MDRENLFYKIWLTLINIPNSNKIFLKNNFKDEEKIYVHFKSHGSYNKIKQEYINRILNMADEDVNKFLDKMERDGVGAIFYGDEDYIDNLNHLYEPPYVLFYKGDISKLKSHKKMSIVGSRKATAYGIQVTEKFSGELAKRDIIIVSGGAYGVDTAAHRGALKAGGITCAILGCGIDVTYPKSNYKLFNDIAKEGVLISEFLPDEKPASYNFPRRNRIIGALGDYLIVTEAAKRSGSLITVNYALDLGKTIYAVPGNPIMPQCEGCIDLIKEGAYPLYDIDQMLEDLNIKDKKVLVKNFSGEKGIVLREIGISPIHINDLIRRCNIDINAIYGILFELQLENEIISLSGNYYARIS